MFSVYAAVNKNGKIYIGQSRDIEQRLKRHNRLLPHKKKSYTYKQGGEWKVIYTEKFETQSEALIRGRQLKGFRGREFVKSLIIG